MKSILTIFTAISFVVILSSCTRPKEKSILDKNNLIAWCIVPYDSVQRGPEARAKMLNELRITKFAWDWRSEHVETLGAEIDALRANEIELSAVWVWADPASGRLIDDNLQMILKTLKEKNVKTQLWLSFQEDYFKDMPEDKIMERATTMVGIFYKMASEIDCKIALYNHGSWFGDPRNQVKVIEALKFDDIGIVYNFHHAHDQINEFPELLEIMKPYLITVNLNGMKVGGPKILTINEGDREAEMLRVLIDSGYKGKIGILGHTENEDVKVVLERNMEGLKNLAAIL